jgi:formylglycine-generating enzyme required for sulfatase activity
MRSDFLDAFQRFEGAAESYEKVTLDPMPRSRFAEVIEGPADRFGLDLDPGLAEQMAAETAYNAALPLLAFTLEKLYDKCKAAGRLTTQAYDELGGVSAAIKHTAEAILKETGYKGLPADDPRMRDLRRAFYSLAQVGEEGQFTRRTARWSRMPGSCEAILKRFVDQRLLVSDAANGELVLSVAHEALFRVWDTLNGWLRDDRKALALRSQIEDAAAEWHASNRAASRAWAEERVLDAVRVIEDSGVSLDDVTDRATVDAFLGPTEPEEIATLPALDAAQDAAVGSGRYGDAWRLPLSHKARASVGVRLALRGDHREGVDLRADSLPDIAWHFIEGGEVTIEVREVPNDPNSEITGRLTRTVAPFWMARYPVTVSQFRAFLDACHREGEWRLPPDYLAPKPRARYGNHPVDSVNWFDASAFCHWLGAHLGFEVRLPTEFEWQQAATGGDLARTYPWGADWDPVQEPWRANMFESGLGRTTAVGMYPAGASPADILDMAGTLWEWCLNAFDDPDNTAFPVSQEDRRVLRGGSWLSNKDGARVAGRGRDFPFYRVSRIGFRVVCSSPSTER